MMKQPGVLPTLRKIEWVVIVGVALVKFALYLLCGNRYDFFVDEYYFLDCANHLDWGYVDQPPLSIFLLKVVRILFGDSLYALRLFPTLAGIATIFLSGFIAKTLGAGVYGIGLACLAMFVFPFNLLQQSLYTMNAFDIVFWLLANYLLILIINGENRRLWYFLGIVLGLGVLNKLSVLWLCVGIPVAMLLPPLRSWYRRKEPYLCALIVFVIFSPHLLWQTANSWPTLEFIKNTTALNYNNITRLDIITWIPNVIHPVNTVIALFAVYALLKNEKLKKYRPIALALLIVFLILIARGKTKAYYLASGFAVLLSIGSVAVEQAIKTCSRWWWIPVYGTMAISGYNSVLAAAPVLPPGILSKRRMSFWELNRSENMPTEQRLPQYFANEFGWREAVDIIGRAYNNLSDAEKKECVIFTTHYGYAGALNLLGSQYGLPTTICTHNSYWLWGSGDKPGNVMIIIGMRPEYLSRIFHKFEITGVVTHQYSYYLFNNAPVIVCRGIKLPLQSFWSVIRLYE